MESESLLRDWTSCVLAVLLEGQSDEQNFDLGLVVFDGVVPLVLRKDPDQRGLVDDSVSTSVFAALGFDALVPKPFVSVFLSQHCFSPWSRQ